MNRKLSVFIHVTLLEKDIKFPNKGVEFELA